MFFGTTSPYARIARMALAEKGLTEFDGALTDPWNGDPDMLAANPSARVPACVLDSGLPLTESLLIMLWLEKQRPAPSLLGAKPDRAISRADVAMGAIDAAAAIIISRRIYPGFDESPVGLRRTRSVIRASSGSRPIHLSSAATPPTSRRSPRSCWSTTSVSASLARRG